MKDNELLAEKHKAVRRNHGRVPPNGNLGRILPIRAYIVHFSADHVPVSALL
jgi:hypothetical protein